ncbi:MAG TPA: carboxypeptidase regulatory-like domain-containing protein [Gemmatimonadaceae bacterium]
MIAAFAVLGSAMDAAAQTLDVIRGRIIDPDKQPISGAQVTVSAITGALSRATRTDGKGRYTVTFPGGEGDYFVTVFAIGFSPRRIEVKRVADDDILVLDATLARAATSLDAMRIRADRMRPSRMDAGTDVSGTEQLVDPATIAAAQAGDLAQMASALSGVFLVPGADGDPSGFSVLGLGQDQNSMTLNGQTFMGASIPADAPVSISVTTSPYDVSRGGFSGANLNVHTRSGSNFKVRTSSLLLDRPSLQWTDQTARALGQEYSKTQLGGLISGPLQYDRAYYSVAYQASRQSRALQTVLNTTAAGLEAAGLARDSVVRLENILNGLGTPAATSQPLDSRLADQASVLAQFDLAPRSSGSGAAYSLTMSGSWNRLSPASQLLPGAGTAELPVHSGDRTNWSGSIQGQHSTYFGFGILTQTNVAVGESQSTSRRFLQAPSASVLVHSSLADEPDAVTNVMFGGSATFGTAQQTRSAQATNQLSWFSSDNKHRLKLTTELRNEVYGADLATNELGTFTFNSLADLEAGRPSTFTRTRYPSSPSASLVSGAVSLGDWYRPNDNLQFQYGLRLDRDAFGQAPDLNRQLEPLFGVRNDFTPDGFYASPRAGFAWSYGQAAQISGSPGAFRGPRAVVRGGVGVFQSVPSARLIVNAKENSGLRTSLQQVTCTGPAVPLPNWTAYATDSSSIPTECAGSNETAPFATSAPNVTLFAHRYVAPRSIRSNLSWTGAALDRVTVQVEGTYSLNQGQPSWVDLNFKPSSQFTLDDERGRPVYVPMSSIDAATGQVAIAQSRVSSAYNRVLELRSDLHSDTKQVRVAVAPLGFSSRWSWRLAYAYQDVREQARGFNANTSANPVDVQWGRASLDARHQIQYSLFYNAWDVVRFNWNGRFQSGFPFTPMVAGDVNGDGYANDRAYIFIPASVHDSLLAASMRSLLEGASSAVRRCLTNQLGTVAARNSCTAPWSATANVSAAFNTLKLGLPQRGQLALEIQNALGVADLIAHGSDHLHGWGQMPTPDQNLLYLRGFDAAARRYLYDVNGRFGSTNAAAQSLRTPIVVTAIFRFDFGPTRERQVLAQQLNLGRTSDASKLSAAMLRTLYAAGGGLLNPIAQILRQSDTLALSPVQIDSLASLNRLYTQRVDSIWLPVVNYLAQLADRYDEPDAYAHYRRAREATVDLLKALAPAVVSLMTPAQRRELPPLVASYLDIRFLSAIRSGTLGGSR